MRIVITSFLLLFSMSTEKNFENFLGKSIIEFEDEYSFLGDFRLDKNLHTIVMEDKSSKTGKPSKWVSLQY